MDKTYLLNRSREEQARADAAKSEEARLAHEGLARCFKEAAEREDAPAIDKRLGIPTAAMSATQQQQP